MNSAQKGAFESGSAVLSADLILSIASVFALAMLIWLAWIAIAQLKLWRDGRISLYDVVWNVLRAAILTLLLGFLIR